MSSPSFLSASIPSPPGKHIHKHGHTHRRSLAKQQFFVLRATTKSLLPLISVAPLLLHTFQFFKNLPHMFKASVGLHSVKEFVCLKAHNSCKIEIICVVSKRTVFP